MKLHLAFLSAFASLAAAAVADIAPPFTEEPGGVGKRDDVKDSTFPKNVDYWSKLSMEQDKVHGLENPSTPPEKRDDVKDSTSLEKPMGAVKPEREFEPLPAEIPPDFKPTAKWSPPCRKTCERDIDCCYTDKCSKDKKGEGLFDERFPKGYPM
ncbi:hypothetical protein BDV33DRAFT_208072 [Aspergillus novoparasiticus]|uniref:Uncharacterized protein n=1 Tax=Aspergillus novoparasiticus TaxID=986946 RepID=A0A5N6EFS0_9EURO|nr:hypothetical protein BDV33DRAFT_208072 [Aspergillus novoparasiticus]